MSGNVTTGETTTESSNPDVRKLVSTISKGITGQYSPTGSTYVAPSATTQSAWSQALQSANNPGYSSDLAATLGAYGKRASGAELGMNDPGYAQLRADLADDTMTSINSAFNSSGMFGSDMNIREAAKGVASATGALDYQQYNDSLSRQAEAAGMMGDLYRASTLPSSVTGAIGAEMDADARAKQLGNIDYLQQFMNLLNGASGAAGQTTTQEMPWWKVGLGGAAAIGSIL